MNSYITLDSKKYSTSQKAWKPRVIKPATVRLTLLGNLDSTYGSGPLYEFVGEIRAEVTAKTGYGTPSDLRTSLDKKQGLTFTDHMSVGYTAHVREYEEDSLSPVWDANANVIFFSVSMLCKKT